MITTELLPNLNKEPREKSGFGEVNEICALALLDDVTEKEYICAVARSDKSLCIYKLKAVIDADDAKVLQQQSLTTTPSVLSYRSPKRVSALTFGSIPINAALSAPTVPILIAADVVGDAYAYSLEETQKGQRLLLGHTASMLTGVALVDDHGNNNTNNDNGAAGCKDLLLTADRDEKIRISRFPESYVIEGYLLGHTEYISALATAKTEEGLALAVSCGGDMTIRLWDISALEELFTLQLETNSVKLAKDETAGKARIPTDIAMDNRATTVAVIFDDCRDLEVYSVTETSSRSLSRIGPSTPCPSQPLSVEFDPHGTLRVVMREPNYMAAYRIQPALGSNGSLDVVEEASDPWTQAVRVRATQEGVTMPETVLEKDEHGLPKIQRANETRGPSSGEAPWNRVERVDMAKQKESRRNKKRKQSEKPLEPSKSDM